MYFATQGATMRSHPVAGALIAIALCIACLHALAAPPFYGTISMHPEIIMSSDPSSFLSAEYVGRGMRNVFDRRIGVAMNVENMHILLATFDMNREVEFRVHPEFETQASAESASRRYAHVIGQLPAVLLQRLRSVTILMGTKPFGGSPERGELLIHVGQAREYENDGILEETLMHEASHVSLDPVHARATGWIEAQQADDDFISIYARNHPFREDIAESFLPYFALRCRPDRISPELREKITTTIPHRIAYFDEHIGVKAIGCARIEAEN